MYYPKIRADLIPRLYRLAKAQRIPMTRLVAQLLESALAQQENGAESVSDPPAEEYQSTFPPHPKGGEP